MFLDICNVKQILTMITRIRLLWKSYLVCSDVNERYDIMTLVKLLLPSSLRFFALQVIWGLCSCYRYFSIFNQTPNNFYFQTPVPRGVVLLNI